MNVADAGMFQRLSGAVRGRNEIEFEYHKLGDVRMDFKYRDYFGTAPNTGYETLLYDVMIGDATLFQRADNIEAGWRVVQPILDVWRANPPTNFPDYKAGTDGPDAAEQMLARDDRSWRPIA